MDHLPSQSGSHAGPLPAFRALVDTGALEHDSAQEQAAAKLQDLWERLRGYDPRPSPEPATPGFIGRLLRRRHAEEYVPLGLYLVGDVGRGKSMLMDLFYDVADVPRKQRIHFHKFMQQAHARIHQWKRTHTNVTDPIPPLADSIAADAALLCFDEFQVNDIADAMILGRLFQALFDRGVVVVATSNTEPDNLFKGQPGRDAFVPFIGLLKQRLDVLVMDGVRDYRRGGLRGLRTWHVRGDDFSRRELDKVFAMLVGDAPVKPVTLTVMGRELVVQQ